MEGFLSGRQLFLDRSAPTPAFDAKIFLFIRVLGLLALPPYF